MQAVAGNDYPALVLGDAAHLLDGVLDPWGGLLEQGGIVAVELDLDRLGHRREVADEVLHQLGGLDLQARNGALNLARHLVHDLLDRPPAAGLEPNEEVAGIGLGETAAELGSGPPGIGVDVRRSADDRLDLAQQPVGLGERHARRGHIVEDEAAFVDLGDEARSHAHEADEADDRQDGDGSRGEQWTGHATLQKLAVGREHAPVRLQPGESAAPGRQLLDQQRHHPPGNQERDG